MCANLRRQDVFKVREHQKVNIELVQFIGLGMFAKVRLKMSTE